MDGEQIKIVRAMEKFEREGYIEDWYKALEHLYKKEIGRDAYGYVQKFRRSMRMRMKSPILASESAEYMKKGYILSAHDIFDDYVIAMEWERPADQQFYLPRRDGLLPMVEGLQRLADDELDLLCVSLPPGVGKSTTAHFFLTWLAGRNPYDGMLEASHSASFVHGVYLELLRMLDPNGEYIWHEIFPDTPERKMDIVYKNGENLQIAISKAQRFPTFQLASIQAPLAGKVRAVQLLYMDDLIEGIEEAVSKPRLDAKWRAYTDDLLQRKQGNCKELAVMTRWSVSDPIGRLEEMHKDDDRALFLNIPALNEQGESNFDYGGKNGFTTEFYNNLKMTMDEASFGALYMGKPIEREGQLYKVEDLRRFYQLPEGEPDAVFACVDPAEGGGDDTVMPVFAVYGNDHYMIDCVCCDDLPEVTDALLAEKIVTNRVKKCPFESNGPGGRTADKVESLVREAGWSCDITKKRTLQNKETKIYVNSTFVKKRCLFLDAKKIKRGSMYDKFMRNLLTYTIRGKNKHDDVPDALAQYALFVEDLAEGLNTFTVLDRARYGRFL